MKTRSLTITVAAAATLTLAACSSGSDAGHSGHNMTSLSAMNGGSTTSVAGTAAAAVGSHNQADITFATDMIPHHRQAVTMSDIALKQASNAQVRTLAKAIKAAQNPEISQMAGWLTAWKQPVPSASMGGMSGMGKTGPGMMTGAQMTALGTYRGPAFDRLWVTMMISHHQGAVAMARTELSAGRNTTAKSLARSIVTGQSAQITQLRKLLTQLRR